MTPEPPPPSQGSEPGSGRRTDSGERSQPGDAPPGELYGPVAIARHVKDDGRALLLYTHTAAREPA